MADNKQYITQIQDNGTVMISEDVIETIAQSALAEVEGICPVSAKPSNDIVELLGKNWGKGMRIQIGEDNSLSITCNVVVKYGTSVVEAARGVQSAISSAVESMTGVAVNAVHVNICGVQRQ